MNSKICSNRGKVCRFMIFFLFCWLKAYFIWKNFNFKVHFKFQVRPNKFGRGQLMLSKLWNLNWLTNRLKFLANACKKIFFFFLFLFFLLIISCHEVCLQERSEICDLQITQNNISHPKSLMINYKLSESVFLSFCADSSMLLFENCREVGFQAKYAIFVLQIMQIYKSPYTTDY